MKDALITFETAKLAKEKGYEPLYRSTEYVCGFIYDEDDFLTPLECKIQEEDYVRYTYYLRPTQPELQRWLRDQYKLYVQVSLIEDIVGITESFDVIVASIPKQTYVYESNNSLIDYETALEEGLFNALKLI